MFHVHLVASGKLLEISTLRDMTKAHLTLGGLLREEKQTSKKFNQATLPSKYSFQCVPSQGFTKYCCRVSQCFVMLCRSCLGFVRLRESTPPALPGSELGSAQHKYNYNYANKCILYYIKKYVLRIAHILLKIQQRHSKKSAQLQLELLPLK